MFDRHFAVWPPGLPRSLTPPETTLPENLDITVRRFPTKTAIHYYGTAITWAELGRSVDRLAGWLQRVAGVKRSDRVLLYLQNCPQFIIGYYAILRAGGVVVPVNPMSRTEELRHIAEDTAAKVAITGTELTHFLAPLLSGHPLEHVVEARYADYLREATDLAVPAMVTEQPAPEATAGVTGWTDALAADLAPGPLEITLDDWCVLPYSSGTTGKPKGCLHTHRTVGVTTYGAIIWNPCGSESVVLSCMPLFHVVGMQGSMNSAIFAGTTMVLMSRWDRKTAVELIQRHRITNFRCITTMLIDLLSDPEVRNYDLSSLRMVSGGGAQVPKAIADKLHELTGLDFIEGYGLTETIAPSHINPLQSPKRQCGGIPIFDVDSRVVNPETLEELGPNQTGEIITAAPQLFIGYWNNPEADAEVFFERDGKRFFRTGDLGYYDEQGYFFLVDRLKRMINASGFKVWPAEIEAMMYEHPAIKEVCIISTPDPRRGETVKAVIVPAEGAMPDPDEIRAWCKDRMATYKVPSVVSFTDALPKSGSNKVLWRVLQEEEFRAAREVGAQAAVGD